MADHDPAHSGDRPDAGQPASGQAADDAHRRWVLFERDEHGVSYAIEVVEAERWDDALLQPPAPERADGRLVRLRTGPAPEPAALPRWLSVQITGPAVVGPPDEPASGAGYRVVEAPATYELDAPAATPDASLWPWSPHFRAPGPPLAEFLTAAATALRYPNPAPTGAARQAEQLRAFCAGRRPPLAQLAGLQSDALERWLLYAFGDPERLAYALLLERIDDDGAGEVAATLRFVADAEVPVADPAHTELAMDRRVLLEQASPWRYLDGEPFEGPLALAQAWIRRYRLAYDAHYRRTLEQAAEWLAKLRHAERTVAALERFDTIAALGDPVGAAATSEYRTARSGLEALPDAPAAEAPRTAGLRLAAAPELFEQAERALAAVHVGLELQRRRLASSAVRLVLDRSGVPALDRLLQAIRASDLYGIERGLDEALAAHIDSLLSTVPDAVPDAVPDEAAGAAAGSPLAALADRYPEVTPGNLDAIVAALGELLSRALADSDQDRVRLAAGTAPPS